MPQQSVGYPVSLCYSFITLACKSRSVVSAAKSGLQISIGGVSSHELVLKVFLFIRLPNI